jgi:hypothetical protein
MFLESQVKTYNDSVVLGDKEIMERIAFLDFRFNTWIRLKPASSCPVENHLTRKISIVFS